tara:strand:+ start:428 stop:1066 length:639 start_codon:yes stop_codon:yes gene_type:complete
MLLKLRNTLISLSFIYFLGLETPPLKAEMVFNDEDHCLAYQTEETILLFFDSIVIGKTCEISVRFESTGNGKKLLVSFPIQTLDSGVGLRDKDVTKMLSFETSTDILFVSDYLTEDKISSALSQGKIKLGGLLTVAGKSHRVLFPLKLLLDHSETWLVTGKLITSLSDLGLELPSVLGGVVAETRDYLEILVHLRFQQVKGVPVLQSMIFNQ